MALPLWEMVSSGPSEAMPVRVPVHCGKTVGAVGKSVDSTLSSFSACRSLGECGRVCWFEYRVFLGPFLDFPRHSLDMSSF